MLETAKLPNHNHKLTESRNWAYKREVKLIDGIPVGWAEQERDHSAYDAILLPRDHGSRYDQFQMDFQPRMINTNHYTPHIHNNYSLGREFRSQFDSDLEMPIINPIYGHCQYSLPKSSIKSDPIFNVEMNNNSKPLSKRDFSIGIMYSFSGITYKDNSQRTANPTIEKTVKQAMIIDAADQEAQSRQILTEALEGICITAQKRAYQDSMSIQKEL